MEITIETGSYNQRRMGRPWIAIVDFTQSAKGEFNWGEWTGDHYNGGAGILSISANPGDIIAKGQKDNRKPKNSAPDFYVVCADGKLSSIGDKGAAYKHYLANKTSVPDTDTLAKERKAAAFKDLLEAARYVVRMKPRRCRVWVPVRQGDDGRKWFDIESWGLLREIAEASAKETAEKIPTWAASNPIVRFALVELKEVQDAETD